VVNAVGCCGDPVTCPIQVVEPPYDVTYYTDPATSYMVLASSMSGAPIDPADPPAPTPNEAKFDVIYGAKQAGSVYRDLTIPYTSWQMTPYSAQESVNMLNYVTISVDWSGTTDGDGKLYVETGGASPAPDNGDVDYLSNILDTGPSPEPVPPVFTQQMTWGDGTVDPNGSAWMRVYLLATVWSSFTGPTDPCDPLTWGSPALGVPLELFLTTGEAENHVEDLAEANRPGVGLHCHTIPDAAYSPTIPLVGAPFAEAGGLLPYVGTPGTIVGATGGVDYLVLGFVEIDFQVEFYWDVSTTPWVDPCAP
jgi:hypothetical protein